MELSWLQPPSRGSNHRPSCLTAPKWRLWFSLWQRAYSNSTQGPMHYEIFTLFCAILYWSLKEEGSFFLSLPPPAVEQVRSRGQIQYSAPGAEQGFSVLLKGTSAQQIPAVTEACFRHSRWIRDIHYTILTVFYGKGDLPCEWSFLVENQWI